MPSALPMARIRPFEPTDDKLVHFIVSKANLESLAVANRRACTHPLTLSAWLVLSGILIDFVHLWPAKRQCNIAGYLAPVPLVAAMAVPIMFLIDWLNRPSFEQHVQAVLKASDLADVFEYYSRSPSSAFWILDYGDQFVGLIALDAHQETVATTLSSLSKKAYPDKSQRTASTAYIRHFYVDEAYRGSRIQLDLLTHAIQVAFESDPSLQYIKASDSSLITYVQSCLQDAGFRFDCVTGRIGVYKWKLGLRMLERGDWEKKAKFE